MQVRIPNIWHLCHLHRSKVLILGLFLFVASQSSAQNDHNYNYLDFQKKPYYFGLTMGLNTSHYRINHSRQFINNQDSIYLAEGGRGPGFTLQIIGNLKIGEYFDFRFLPGFTFTEKKFEYNFASFSSFRKIESIFFETPFLVRFKSAPYKDKRAFVVAGMKYSYDVASNSKTRQAASLIKISPHDFQLEVGAGVQFFFPYFIFSPEIKVSQGIGNVLIYNRELAEASVLEKLQSRMITLSFHFEG